MGISIVAKLSIRGSELGNTWISTDEGQDKQEVVPGLWFPQARGESQQGAPSQEDLRVFGKAPSPEEAMTPKDETPEQRKIREDIEQIEAEMLKLFDTEDLDDQDEIQSTK